MLFSTSLFVALLAATAEAVPQFQPRGCNQGQKATDVATIKQQITHPVIFCNWFLSLKRTRYPPIRAFPNDPGSDAGFTRFSNACQCIAKKRQSQQGAKAKTKPRSVKIACTQKAKNLLIKEIKQPLKFCNFWDEVSWREVSPFGKYLTNVQVYNACRCYINPATTSSTTTSESTTSTTTSETTTTTTSTTTTTTTDLIVIPTTTSESSSTTTTSTTTTDLIVIPTTTSTTTTDSTTTTTTSETTTTTPTTTTTTTTTSDLPVAVSTLSLASPSATVSSVGGGALKKMSKLKARGRKYSEAGKAAAELAA
ncbi:hypothetical protein CAC42_232 [Sphaceloma murrayae]|uniref:Uncharacterized protein n=1 Tax=Sphaceloma murrayae TaxID=2082308 RepID=A0A2K1QMX7_9PEZI|nr:hypothetical protein CAC42_232 [Sphaceloma murrayae]